MALGSTLYNFDINLSDVGRGEYHDLSLRVARHSSESAEFMLCRVLAYCLEYAPGLEFTKGLDEPELPAIWLRDPTGKVTHWIEVGAPSVEKLHKAAKSASHVAVYTHKPASLILGQLTGQRIFRAEEISVFSFAPRLFEQIAAVIDRRSKWEAVVSDGSVYLNVGGQSFESAIERHAIA